jgi:serine/threonine protein kinase
MPVDLATKLCQLARPGEILLPEHTLTHLLRTLPENWQHVRAESEFEPDLSDFQWSGDEIAPVPEQLKKVVYLLGPGVQENSDNVELYFDYLWAYQVPGRDTAVPILRVVRPAEVGSQLELSDDNVVTTQAVQTLGKYKLIEVIGTGGMGKVWRGVDRFGNSVAIKVLHSAEPATDTQLRRFRREAEVMAKLPHRNICRVYEMNEFDGIQYIAMEFVDGLPLSDLLYEKTASESSGKTLDNVDLRVLITSLKSERSRSRSSEGEGGEDGETASRPKNTRILPVEQTLSIILKVSDAVQFAHEHGILHRDLKPGNILLREDGEPLVADFGLAKMSSADATHSLSISGHVVGTLENMSPEQAESSKDVDERADVYSIGTMLYQMLTGRRHFEATGNIVADAQVLKTHEPVRPRAFNPRINPDLEIITLKALRNDPVERYRSVAALAADIQHYRRGEVISARPVHLFEVFKKLIQRNKGVSAVVAASIVIFVVGALVSIAILSHSLTEQNRVVSQLKERDAEVARKSAEIAEQIAKNKEISVEIQDKVTLAALSEKNADIARKRAKDALEELKAKQAEVEAEQQKSKEAVAKTKEALAASEEDKRLREELEQRIEKARLEEERQSGDVSSPPSSRSEAQRQESLRAVQQQFDQARQLFFLEASPFFPRQQANADGIIDRLKDAMDHVTQALLISPDFLPGWMLKGRIHLVLLEYDRAAESFREALKYVDNFPGAIAKDNPEVMVKLTRELSAGLGDKYSKGAEILDESPDPQNKTTGQMMKIVAGKPGSKFSTDPAGPLNRAVTANEAALALLARNPPGTKVFVKPGGIGVGTEIILWGSSEITDLSPLKEIELSGLTIAGAKKIDWPTLFTLTGLESLNLSQCGLERFPVTPQSQRSFLNLKSLCLAGTHVNSLDFIRTMTGLEKLDLTNSDVTDLTPLLLIRDRLRELKLGGLNPVNLRALLNIPLESLTVSPMLISDQAGLIALSQNRVLKVIRAPGDPKDQSAAEFWRKLESHAYATSE